MYHIMAGLLLPNSMRVIRQIGSQKVVILMDTGATHNFINNKVIDKLDIIKKRPSYVGSPSKGGTKLPSYIVCPNVEIKIHNTRYCVDLYVLPIGGADIILGV